MKLERNTIVGPFKSLETERPWGHYMLCADNEPSTTKVLFIKPEQSLSMQYHFRRSQFYMVLSSDITVQYSTIPVPKEILDMPPDDKQFKALNDFLDSHLITVKANKYDMFAFRKYVIHRTSYHGKEEHGLILDVALQIDKGDCNDELDIVRISDFYGRSNFKN